VKPVSRACLCSLPASEVTARAADQEIEGLAAPGTGGGWGRGVSASAGPGHFGVRRYLSQKELTYKLHHYLLSLLVGEAIALLKLRHWEESATTGLQFWF